MPDTDEAERGRLRRRWQDQHKADFKRGFEHLLNTRKLRTENGFAWEFDAKRVGA